MTSLKTKTADDLVIPAFLKRDKGGKPLAKPALAKPALAMPAAAPVSAPGRTAAARTANAVKAATKGKAAAAGKLAAPAPESQAAAKALLVAAVEGRKPAATAALKAPKGRPGLPPAQLVKAIREHGKKFQHQNGWDLLIADWSDADIAKAIDGVKFRRPAIAVVRKLAQALDRKRPKDRPAPAKVKA